MASSFKFQISNFKFRVPRREAVPSEKEHLRRRVSSFRFHLEQNYRKNKPITYIMKKPCCRVYSRSIRVMLLLVKRLKQ